MFVDPISEGARKHRRAAIATSVALIAVQILDVRIESMSAGGTKIEFAADLIPTVLWWMVVYFLTHFLIIFGIDSWNNENVRYQIKHFSARVHEERLEKRLQLWDEFCNDLLVELTDYLGRKEYASLMLGCMDLSSYSAFRAMKREEMQSRISDCTNIMHNKYPDLPIFRAHSKEKIIRQIIYIVHNNRQKLVPLFTNLFGVKFSVFRITAMSTVKLALIDFGVPFILSFYALRTVSWDEAFALFWRILEHT